MNTRWNVQNLVWSKMAESDTNGTEGCDPKRVGEDVCEIP